MLWFLPIEPCDTTSYIDGSSDGDHLQMGFGQADVARTAHPKGPHIAHTRDSSVPPLQEWAGDGMPKLGQMLPYVLRRCW